MPISIPAFVQYQAPLIPLRGLWHNAPVEGDRFVSCEIDWQITTGPYNCVQFALAGNSPVSLSQIVALNVDNARNGSDIQFLFPDSGYVLVVPAYNQGLYPVLTNALTFYCTSALAGLGDTTVFQICNSIPPVTNVQPSQEQSFAVVSEIPISQLGTYPLVAPPGTGTLEAFSLIASSSTAPAGNQQAILQLVDGNGMILWRGILLWEQGSTASTEINVSGLRQRFYNGLYLQVVETTIEGGFADMNVYFSVP